MTERRANQESAWVRFAPGITRLRRYERACLRADALAGVTVAAYLVPQVMAYAQVAGLEPVAGLWAITGSLLVYAALGSSPQLSVGPESTAALMTATAVAPLAMGDLARYAVLAAALGLVVGALCLVAWVARLGFLSDLLSKPVLIGYMAGVAAIMIASQLGKLSGIPVEGDSFIGQLRSFAEGAGDVHGPTVALGIAVLVFLLVTARFLPRAPAPLVGMLLATGAAALFALERRGVAVIGSIPAGVPLPRLPDVSMTDLVGLLLPAVGVAIVCYSDNALTARAFAARNRYEIDPTRSCWRWVPPTWPPAPSRASP